MKDWSLLGIILGLTIILSAGIFEQIYLKNLSEDMVNEISDVEAVVLSGDIENGSIKLQKVIDKWKQDEKTLGIIINHGDINRISEALTEIDNKLENFFESDNVSSNFALLKEYIININKGNEFTIPNIL